MVDIREARRIIPSAKNETVDCWSSAAGILNYILRNYPGLVEAVTPCSLGCASINFYIPIFFINEKDIKNCNLTEFILDSTRSNNYTVCNTKNCDGYRLHNFYSIGKIPFNITKNF